MGTIATVYGTGVKRLVAECLLLRTIELRIPTTKLVRGQFNNTVDFI
jgi:hypothetical protein